MTTFVRGIRRRLVAVSITLSAMLALVVATTPASASAGSFVPAERAENFWGAIAISVDGAYGTAWNYPTKSSALKNAKVACKKHAVVTSSCTSVVYTVNGCAAVSVRYNGKAEVRDYATAFGRHKKPVIRSAQHKCVKAYGKKCQRLASVCTDYP